MSAAGAAAAAADTDALASTVADAPVLAGSSEGLAPGSFPALGSALWSPDDWAAAGLEEAAGAVVFPPPLWRLPPCWPWPGLWLYVLAAATSHAAGKRHPSAAAAAIT